MLFPQAFIESLRAYFRVSEVVGRRVQLRRHGREMLGLCPFHKEKTPSFTVNDEKGFYHCFGCGAHGDTINFVKEFDGLSYVEAVEKLANEAGMAIPKPSQQEREKEQKNKIIQSAAEVACSWFQSELYGPQGYAAREYLAQRGFTDAIIQQFRVGFAPDNREAMHRALIAEGISEQQMIAAGLIVKTDDGKTYSRFRGRVMFPIRDKWSKVIAFGGRLLPELAQNNPNAPKYLNSPETDLFKKGSLLYNYDLARKPAMEHERVVVCEGYTDVVSLYQAGIEYGVAPLGTAVTAEQLRLLWQLCNEPVMCLDGDAAGARAMQRVSELALPLLQPGKTLKFVQLPKGEDPDSLVKSGGKEAFVDLVDKAPGLSDMIWQNVSATASHTPEGKAGLEHELMMLCEKIQHPTVKAHYRSHFKQKVWQARQELPKQKGQSAKSAKAAIQTPYLPQAKDLKSQVYKASRQCLVWVLLYPNLLADPDAEEFFACMVLDKPDEHELRQKLLAIWAENGEITREEIHKAMDETEFASTYQTLLADHRADVSAQFRDDVEANYFRQAQYYWRMCMNACYMPGLKEELQRAESELSFEQLPLIKAQLEAMEKERAQLYNKISEAMMEMA